MAKVEVSAVINRPIEEVFAFAANIENNAQWQSGVLEAQVTSEGPTGVGTTYRYATQLLGPADRGGREDHRVRTEQEVLVREHLGTFPNRGWTYV